VLDLMSLFLNQPVAIGWLSQANPAASQRCDEFCVEAPSISAAQLMEL
jgi:hypothetical protein